MSERREEVAPVVSDDHTGTSGACHLGNVRIVDAAACRAVLRCRLKQSQAIGGWQIVDRYPAKDFFLE